MLRIEIAIDDKPGHTGDYKIGEALERAITTMIKNHWDAIAEGKLHFQDMSYNNGKTVTSTDYWD